jgi:Arc/MetJ family transcription regulator
MSLRLFNIEASIGGFCGEMGMRKTTVLIDENLLAEAIQIIGARTKKEAIEAGLRPLIEL